MQDVSFKVVNSTGVSRTKAIAFAERAPQGKRCCLSVRERQIAAASMSVAKKHSKKVGA
jgi:hypothetical protein